MDTFMRDLAFWIDSLEGEYYTDAEWSNDLAWYYFG